MEITRSADGHQPTVERLIAAVQRRGLTLVARIDHAGMAKDAGLDLSPVEVIVFGNPKVGTPLMVTDPGSASNFRCASWCGPTTSPPR